MKYFKYGYEDYNGNKGEIVVKANTKEESWNRIHDYEVSRGLNVKVKSEQKSIIPMIISL